jgi:hypothetical protein
MPKLPLNIGLPVLVAVLLAGGMMEFGPWRDAVLTIAIAIALWTAFSLKIGRPDPETSEEEPPTPALDDPDPDAPEPLRALTEEEQKELEETAVKHRPWRKP